MDTSLIARWIESVANRPGDIAEVFLEADRQTALEWRDGEVVEALAVRQDGVSARLCRGAEERLASVPGTDEGSVREAIRALREPVGRPPPPSPPARETLEEEEEQAPLLAEIERWRRRLTAIFERHAPRHRFRWTLRESRRGVVPAALPPKDFSRRLLSLEGTFTAASRREDEPRRFSFHAPLSDGTADELRAALSMAAAPRERALPFANGEADVVFAGGSAAVFFHEILSHPLEAEAGSPLAALLRASVAVPALEVRDDPTRLDLFGGYESDDEGTSPRPVRLVDAGRIGGMLTDRRRAGGGGATGHARRAGPPDAPRPRGSNLVVAPGHSTTEELARRLASGLWIEEIDAGSIELASGQFLLHFPRARRVRRGGLADELGAGVLAGEILPALKGLEAALGRDVRPSRSLGWCAHGGQVLPIQGEAPDVLVRRLAVRSLS